LGDQHDLAAAHEPLKPHFFVPSPSQPEENVMSLLALVAAIIVGSAYAVFAPLKVKDWSGFKTVVVALGAIVITVSLVAASIYLYTLDNKTSADLQKACVAAGHNWTSNSWTGTPECTKSE